MRILGRIAEHAAARPDSLAAHTFGACGGAGLTYARLWELTRSLAAILDERAPSGGVVMLSCPNRLEFFIAVLGTLAAGRTIFPVHPKLTSVELIGAAAQTRARVIIGEAGAMDAVSGLGLHAMPVSSLLGLAPPPAALSDAGTPGLMLQSSGTTGLPKIVYRDGLSLDAVAANVAASARLTPEDRVLAVVPLGHSYGIENGLLGPLWAGACAHVCDGFDVPAVMGQLRTPIGATVLPGGAFMFEMLGRMEEAGRGRSALRLAYSAGSALPGCVASAFTERFGLRIGQLYGASEVGSVTFNDPGEGAATPPGFDPASVGTAMDGVRIAVLDPASHEVPAPLPPGEEGHVAVHAPSMMLGYIGQGASPFVTVDGVRHFPTGDLGRLDDSGRLWITGRLKLMIDIGGVKVNPLEVEQVLAEHGDVGRCVVVAMPVSETVSRVKAIVTPRRAGGRVDVESLRAFARERLAGHKVPRVFEVREELPLSPAGKVLRWRL